MVNHAQPDAVQLDQLNTRKRKAPPRDDPAGANDYRPDAHALCAPHAAQQASSRLSIDVAAAAAAAAAGTRCYREDARAAAAAAVGSTSTCSSPGASTSSSGSTATTTTTVATAATSRPAKCLRVTGLSHSAPASPIEKHRRKVRRRDLAARRRYARLYNKPPPAPYPFRFSVAGVGYLPPSPQPSHQLGQSEVGALSAAAAVSAPGASSSRSARASGTASSSSSSRYPVPDPSYFCDGASSSSGSRTASAGLASSRNCLHQSCVAFRFASMIDGVHLSSLSPQGSATSHQSRRAGCFYVPPILPPINRYTLQELDLDAITKNPQLRHDLLFDVGLQFRPTDSKRKRETTDMYWRAVKSELEVGCSCVSFDESRHMHRHSCVCASSSANTSLPQNSGRLPVPCEEQLPIRVPSRIGPLIDELREVLYAVIMPPPPPIRIRSSSTGSQCTNNVTQPRRLTASDEAEVAWLREAFDVPLIEQQLRHGVFNPGKLLTAVSNLLREHCAPVRDPIVDTIMEIAKRCSTRAEASLIDALAAIRLCFDLLELMRLDLANHLLAQLRPYLLASAPTFEASVFERKPNHTDAVTRAWIANSYTKLTSSSDLHASVGAALPPPERIRSLPSVQKVVATVLTALVDLVVFPPNPISAILPPSPTTTPVTKGRQSYHVNVQAGYPETLYLDHSRLLMLSADAADITANAMFLAIFRQLVFAESIKRGRRVSIQDDELLRLKSEISAVGPQRPGVCFCREYSQSEGEGQQTQTYEPALAVWREAMSSAALHLAHAVEKTTTTRSASGEKSGHEEEGADAVVVGQFVPPDAELVASVTSWCKSNMRADSDVARVFRKKVAAETLKALIPRFFVLWNVGVQQRRPGDSHAPFASESEASEAEADEGQRLADDADANALKTKTGMEPLSEEIRVLVERLAKLAVLHLRVYFPLYDRGGFFNEAAAAAAAVAATGSNNK